MRAKTLKYTCLFGGGAVRGAAYVGTIKALQEIGIKPYKIGGSSVGSIVAALFALGFTPDEIKTVFMQVNFELFKDLQLGFGSQFALSKGEVFLDWLREIIEKKYYGDKYKKGKNKAVTFKDLKKDLFVITTDLTNFTCKEFSKYTTPNYEIATAVRISCTMPGLMKPIEYENSILVDGDLQKSMPMWKLTPNLTPKDERILEFRLEGDKYTDGKSAIQFMNTLYSCITSICTDYIANLYGDRDEFDYLTINTGDVIVVDFNCSAEKREELIESGYKQTMDYFTKILPQKKEKLLHSYILISRHLNKMKQFLAKNKIQKMKTTLGDLYMDMCESVNTLDKTIIDEINSFKLLMNKNIKYPALFGSVKLNNQEEITEKLCTLSNMISNKVFELEEYIVKFPI